jgi:hypothetical protein
MTLRIDEPGRLSLSERYGVPVPAAALEEALRRRCGDEIAEQVLSDYRAAIKRYGRAARLERARRGLRQVRGREQYLPPRQQALTERERDLLAKADDYLKG